DHVHILFKAHPNTEMTKFINAYKSASSRLIKRDFPQDHIIKSCTISMTPTGKYYVSILIEYEKEIVQKEVETVVGLDFAMDQLYVSSEDERANYP
ncbi:transposase, partial [Bacillus thuringiensis]